MTLQGIAIQLSNSLLLIALRGQKSCSPLAFLIQVTINLYCKALSYMLSAQTL